MDGSEKNNCDLTKINEKTQIGLTFGQVLAAIGLVFTFGLGYANLTTRIVAVEQKINRTEVLQEKSQQSYNEIKETLIRIEGKLDLKQDRFK